MRSLYALARRADHDTAARAEILAMAAEYAGFEELQRAFRHSFSELALRVPVLEEETAELKTALARRETELKAISALAEANAAQAEKSAAEAEKSAAALAAMRMLAPR